MLLRSHYLINYYFTRSKVSLILNDFILTYQIKTECSNFDSCVPIKFVSTS